LGVEPNRVLNILEGI